MMVTVAVIAWERVFIFLIADLPMRQNQVTFDIRLLNEPPPLAITSKTFSPTRHLSEQQSILCSL